MKIISQPERDELFDEAKARGVLVDGRAAEISGRLSPYPVVSIVGGLGQFEITWDTLARQSGGDEPFRIRA